MNKLAQCVASEIMASYVIAYDTVIPDYALEMWCELISEGFFTTEYLRKLCILALTKIAARDKEAEDVLHELCTDLREDNLNTAKSYEITEFFYINSETSGAIKGKKIPGFVTGDHDEV